MTQKQPGQSILFLEKVFLRKAPRVLRGVELFNTALIRDLLRLGYAMDVPADPSWRAAFEEHFAASSPVFLYGPLRNAPVLNTLGWGWTLARRRYQVLLLGNVGHGLLPLIRLLRASRSFEGHVLIAHRETSQRFLRALRGVPGHVVAVNGKIAAPFRAAAFPSVHVDYGVTQGERFFPRSELPRGDSGNPRPVRFCVVGMLDNAWKGSDTAVAAFRAMPPELRQRAELHLASFSEPPAFEEPNIHALPWMQADRIPEWLRSMDVMICPSRDEQVMRETFSQAMVQGMLSGLPVLASELPIFEEKLDCGGGALFSDAAGLAAKMAEWVDNPEIRAKMGREARETALQRYVWDSARFARRYLQSPASAPAGSGSG